jgi:hypothetical protein
MSKNLVLIFLLFSSSVFSQTIFELDQSKSVIRNGQEFPIPFSMGINSAQILTIDLTGDGKEEWVLWDINSRQLQVFEKSGENFRLLPEMAYFFPSDISVFLVLADFDQDGKKDLFTSTPFGIKAYRNTSQGSQISWTVAQIFLRLDGASNIPANNLDTPLIMDLDGDKDLDLVIFNFAQGDFLEFYKNTSVERKGVPDIDGFAFPINFWGNFSFCSCEGISFGIRCDGRPINSRMNSDGNTRIQHAGGHSILYHDFSGDGIKDLMLGRDECNTLYYLPNQGSNSEPIFTSFSFQLPGYGSLPEFPKYHVGNVINEELMVSLNTNEPSVNFGIDFSKSLVRLKKDGSGSQVFLQNQLFDLGENTRPFFKGNVFAGELWLTANVKVGNKIAGEAFRLSYSGGRFEVLNEDYLNLGSLDLQDIQLLEYADTKNKSLLLISGVKTQNGVPSQVLMKNQGAGFQEFNFSGLKLKLGDQLTFFPYEGKDRLLVASQNGSLFLYQVDFETLTAKEAANNFLGFDDNPAFRNLSIALALKDKPDLYSVDQSGRIFRIKDFMNSTVREEVFVKIGDQNSPLRQGRNTWISVVNPAFDGQVDLILGSRGGGITYLKAAENGQSNEGEFLVKVFPNPTTGPFNIISNSAAKARLISPLGQIILDEISISANRVIEFQTQVLQPGVYFLQLETEDRKVVVRKVLVR